MDRIARTRGPGVGRRVDEGPDGPVTVQLLPEFLVAGELPAVVVGEELTVVPALYAGVVRPGYAGDDDRWDDDEFGTVAARGEVLEVAPDDAGGCTCRVEVLDAAGRLVPINWAAATPASGRVRVEGALYLDPELEIEHVETLALCRRRYRVRAVRRYRRTAWRPVAPVSLPAVPAPGEVSESAVYVADLLPVTRDGP